MKKKQTIFILSLITLSLGTHISKAEWYQVQSVPTYNTIKAVKIDGKNEPVVIRIRNLEKIEYIQPKSEKVLIGGTEAISLAKDILNGQTVWVENLKAEQGALVGDVYPSFEQVINAYKKKRILNGDNISEGMKKSLMIIYKQMLVDLNDDFDIPISDAESQKILETVQRQMTKIYEVTLSNLRSDTPKVSSSKEQVSPYSGKFQRALFSAEAALWFKEKGQSMHPHSQQLFVGLLNDFQTQPDSNARYTYIKLKEIMRRPTFFQVQYFNNAIYERGKFTYTCLEWFKTTGQYLPASVQKTFIVWLRKYQQAYTSDNTVLKARLKWMMENDSLYFDFLNLGK